MSRTHLSVGAALLILGCCGGILPAVADHGSFSVKLGASDFHYQERGRSGETLNTESGLLFGGGLKWDMYLDGVNAYFFAESSGNDVDYDGFTQARERLFTTTDNSFTTWGAGASFYLIDQLSIGTQLSRISRDRHILPTVRTTELRETYRWSELRVFGGYEFSQTGNWRHGIRIGLTDVFDGELVIDLSRQGFGKPDLNLEADIGYFFEFNSRFTLDDDTELGLLAAWNDIDFKESGVKRVEGITSTILIREPASRYRSISVGLALTRRF